MLIFPKVLVHTSKKIYILKAKILGQTHARIRGSSFLSLLTAPQQAGPTDSGISQVLFPRLGPEPRSLGRLGQAFEGRVYPQPGHLEARQALLRGATPQRAPPMGCILRSNILSRQGSWDLSSGMQPWQAVKSLLKVICTNSTLAASQKRLWGSRGGPWG